MKYPQICLALFILAVSCKENREIKVYKVAKETTAGPQNGAPGMMPGGADPGSTMPGTPTGADPHAGLSPDQLAASGAGMPSTPQFSDSPPANWEKQPLSPMRLASYLVKGEAGATADVSLTTLRSAPGGLLSNINRWRDQLGQPPITEAEISGASETVKTAFGNTVVVDIEGLAAKADAAKDGRLIGAIAQQEGNAWFFKMRGNAALAASEKANFIAWIQTVKPEASVAPPAAAEVPAAPAGDGSVSWQLPESWKVVTGNTARYATIQIPGPDGTSGDLSVSHFPGDVGGDLANVNRWLQQIGQPAVDEAALASLITKITAGPVTFSLVDVKGPQSRLAAAWTRHGPDTWFFKLTGPDPLVVAEKAKFTAFMESVRFNTPE